MLDNTYVRIVNNFLHDMATGTWAACVLVMWVLERESAAVAGEASRALARADSALWTLLLAALAVLSVTGGLRLVYWRVATPAHEVAAKRRALVVKHVAFLVVYGGGTWWAWTLVG